MIQNINLGAAPNDKTGTKARVAGQMINANFAYLEAKIDNKSYLKLETGFTLLAQDLTLNADWEWLINGVEYTNPVAVVVAIPLAAAGKSRIDLIVCNSSNTFNRVAGVESVSTPVAPALPTNTVMATFFTVSDGIVSVPEVPSSGTDESTSNKSQTVETDKLSVTKYPSVKALYDWAVGKFQLALVSGTNIKTINGTSVIGSGDITISAGIGDMVLASTQTVSGLKTFLNGMFGLRNAANTFTSFFTNSNTASRTYTLQDKSYTLADNADLTAKANTALTVRKISTATTLAESDNGTVILLTASCTVTLPNALSIGFNCSFVTSAGVTMTYALGGSIVLINNTATTMAEKLSHTITNTGVLNEYITVGL